MLMATEKDILMALDSNSVIDRLAEKSEQLKKLLHWQGEKYLILLLLSQIVIVNQL